MARIVKSQRNTPRVVTLELSEGEADFVLGVTAVTGGHRTRSMRKYADRLQRTLTKALGYTSGETDFERFRAGRVYMREYNPTPESAESDEKTIRSVGIDTRSDTEIGRSVLREILDEGQTSLLGWADRNARIVLRESMPYDDSEETTIKESTWRVLSRWASRNL